MSARSRIPNLAVLAALVLLLALSAGCIGGPDSFPDGDIVVLKLAADGAPQWTRTIDTGEDDGAEDLVELADGGFAIAAQNGSSARHPSRARFVRLAPDGAMLWDRFVTDGPDFSKAVVPTGDGGTAVLTGNGTVVRFDADGRALWSRATGISDAQTLLRLSDGGYVAGGRVTYYEAINATVPPLPRRTSPPDTAVALAGQEGMAARLSADGATVWERRYGESGLRQAQGFAESPDRTGLLLVGYGVPPNATIDVPLLAFRLVSDGTSGPAVQLGTRASPVDLEAEPAGYRLLYYTSLPLANLSHGGVADAVLDRDGRVIESRSLNASIAVARTADGGYVSVGIPSANRPGYTDEGWAPTSAFRVLRFDPSGALVGDRALPTGLISRVKKVVPTADGGCAVLAVRLVA